MNNEPNNKWISVKDRNPTEADADEDGDYPPISKSDFERWHCPGTATHWKPLRKLIEPKAPTPVPAPASSIMEERIRYVCDEVCAMLLAKNAAYGNSAADPVRIFSKADPLEQIKVRIDDKLSRLARGTAAGEDTELDLIGYLILKRAIEQKGDQP